MSTLCQVMQYLYSLIGTKSESLLELLLNGRMLFQLKDHNWS
jgi:hypothetical protein